MNVWRLMAFHDSEHTEKVISWSRREGIIAIGWNTGDLRKRHFTTLSQLEQFAEESNPAISTSNRSNAGRSLWKFYHDVKPGDLVILSGSGYRALTLRVTGDYYYTDFEPPCYYEHRRKANVVPINPDVLWNLAGGVAPGENVRRALIRCSRSLTDAEYTALLS